MSSILDHPDDDRFFIEAVEPLIASVEQKKEYLYFRFRCPISGYEITARVRPGDEPYRTPSSAALSDNPRLAGLLQTALRPGSQRREGTDYTVDEIEEAACDAFESVSRDFFWDGSRWTHWEANDQVLQFLTYGELLRDLSHGQRSILRRVLGAVASADGQVVASEQELIESLLGSDAVTADASLPSADELRGLKTRSVAAAVVCFGYAIACVDGDLDAAEENLLSAVCEAVGLGTLKQWELKRTAQAFLMDEALARIYREGRASNDERLEVYKFGRGLGLSVPDLRELEWRFLRRTGLTPESP